ncbi:hypothetical protein BC941DRAFT_373017 [Chlamydoabsidia padenii]|nr:hypothetical protein BC941DRAFT_373017 [Chlamydoabsidia padenii]
MSQQIYKATYSGVPVYEISCNDVAVMRRKNDSYMNATQILKVADFDKPQRTRILEREVQIGEHEKIQGGYGKYQGTWVPLEKAAQLARHYKVDTLIQPLLDFVKGDESPPLAPKHVTATSTKLRKPRERRTRKKPKLLADEEASDINDDSASKAPTRSVPPPPQQQHNNKSSRQNPSSQHHQRSTVSPLSSPNLSSSASTPPSSADYRTSPTKHKTKKEMEHQRTYAHKLLSHFLSENKEIPALLQRPPRDLDVNVIIDEDGHTCLHWAAVMGHISTVQRLIRIGADVYRVNYKGQTALMRSVLYTNNYDQKSFDQLLGLLSGTIFNIDKSDQTVFHHVAATANGKGKLYASRYYMENLLNKLAHNRSELISILNVQDVCGDTALTIVSRIGNRRLIRLLIDAGASTEIANEEGMTSQDYLAALDSATDKGNGDMDGTATAATTASLYQSEEMTREQIRQKVDAMYKTMLSGNPTTAPSISHWVDDLAASYERDLTQKENAIKEIQRDLRSSTKRLEETEKSVVMLTGNGDKQQDRKKALDQGDQLATELRKLLLYIQKTRIEQWIREKGDKGAGAMGEDNTLRPTASASESTTTGMITKPPTPPSNAPTSTLSGENPTSLATIATAIEEHNINHDDDGKAKLIHTLQSQLDQLQQSRRQLTDDIITQQTTICEKRIQNYKRLISMCCNIAYENVDSMLAPILASFDEAGALTSVNSSSN